MLRLRAAVMFLQAVRIPQASQVAGRANQLESRVGKARAEGSYPRSTTQGWGPRRVWVLQHSIEPNRESFSYEVWDQPAQLVECHRAPVTEQLASALSVPDRPLPVTVGWPRLLKRVQQLCHLADSVDGLRQEHGLFYKPAGGLTVAAP